MHRFPHSNHTLDISKYILRCRLCSSRKYENPRYGGSLQSVARATPQAARYPDYMLHLHLFISLISIFLGRSFGFLLKASRTAAVLTTRATDSPLPICSSACPGLIYYFPIYYFFEGGVYSHRMPGVILISHMYIIFLGSSYKL